MYLRKTENVQILFKGICPKMYPKFLRIALYFPGDRVAWCIHSNNAVVEDEFNKKNVDVKLKENKNQ